MNLPAGTYLYNSLTDVYTYVLSDGTQVQVKGSELQQMASSSYQPYQGLGGLLGGYRTSTQTTHSSSSYGAYSGDPRVQAQIAAAQQAALANSRPGGITYLGTGGMNFIGNTFEQSPPPIIKYEGIKSGEIIAYRCWVIKGETLYSTYTEKPWDPDEPMTGDVGNKVGYAYGYGVHAFKDENKAREYAQIYSYNPIAFGQVKLWGEVIEHERGYRAENARIISLDDIIPNASIYGRKKLLRSIRKHYGVNEYANGNDTDSRQVRPGDGEEERSIEGFGRDDISSVPGDSRKGGCWNYLRGLIQGRRV